MKSSGYVPVIIVLLLAFWSPSLFAQSKASTVEKLVLSRTVIDEELQKRYKAELSKIENRRRAVANYRKEKGHLPGQMEEELIGYFSKVSKEWLSTRWALGNPQASLPGTKDPINCGTFVGRVLNDMGFQVKVSKLQRQPAQLIIQSFVGKKRIRKYSNKDMDYFLKSVQEMGPGLYIIGLDFHVGFLYQSEDDLRFIHASYENEKVRNERAADANPIISSKYRVVGKILSPKNIEDWAIGKEIKVKGKW